MNEVQRLVSLCWPPDKAGGSQTPFQGEKYSTKHSRHPVFFFFALSL